MSRKPLLDPNRSYTFSNYFDLNADPFELIAEFKQIEQGLNLYRVTEDIEAVMRILLFALLPLERTTVAN